MKMRETIEELRHQMYSTMDALDELSQQELQQRVDRRADMDHALQELLSEEDYYGSWQELPVTKEELQSLPSASEKDASRVLDSILHAKLESRIPEERHGMPMTAMEKESYGALNQADIERYQEELERHGAPEEFTRNPALNGMDLAGILDAYDYEDASVVENHINAFLFLQDLNNDRAESIQNGYPMEDIRELQTHRMADFLFAHPDISMELGTLEPAEAFSQLVYDRLQQELIMAEDYCLLHGAEQQMDPEDTILTAEAKPYNKALLEHAEDYLRGDTSLENYLCFSAKQSGRDAVGMQHALHQRLAEARHAGLLSMDSCTCLLDECSMCPSAYASNEAYYQQKGRGDGEFYHRLLLSDKKRNDLMVAAKVQDSQKFVAGVVEGQEELGVKKEAAMRSVRNFFRNLTKNISKQDGR